MDWKEQNYDKMATRKNIASPSRKSMPASSSDVQLHICGVPFSLNREVLTAKSAKLAAVLKENPEDDVSHLLGDIPTDSETFELVARFCHGFNISLSPENVIKVLCLANYLGMSEDHSTNNLIKKACFYFQNNVLPSWNKCIKALKSAETILQQAADLALVDACAESIITKVVHDPSLLGEPIRNVTTTDDDSENDESTYKPNVRRRLFVLDWKSEDLTVLSIALYEPIIRALVHQNVPLEYVSSSLFQYLINWVFPGTKGEDETSVYERNSQREIIEAVERLLPQERGLIPCSLLSQMLQSAITLDANTECKSGLETRIGKQLDQATVKDLLIPAQGYAKEEQYDTECVKRIMKYFYSNYENTDKSGLIVVAQLIDDFLAEVASDRDLKLKTFLTLADLSLAASEGTHRNSDGIYKAIDIYLDKHRYLTDREREEVCRMLDCNNLSPEACEHAAHNEKLPVRVMVQILFSVQLKLKDTVAKRIQRGSGNLLLKLEEDEEDATRTSSSEEEVKAEMEKMGSKVQELEKECHMMRRAIQIGSYQHKIQKEKTSMWKEMKRKFGCMTSLHETNCHVKKKKVHPR
ncbi:PREDICTED: BTB/POZ domain-containing protein At5g17580 [Nicotiana attenuata]|uniref:Btbpoz domain-containing protein n=1 Tax=Nicotiana attenuata TaxID=49451 RepID=A0A314KXM9_NICAT|nr:PREDICTED: BTB/POZ domain-containing protein At5g17580 [Nicotiana attenuata]XP_019267768.1 PREDICTED: BTB/POZ domain-containing protein At5g17580 [Nicotiana attenuata]OIT34166.1 btbpoz domain-containing protein [Nicotiana attenuata]